jgi:hypothetical protein
MATQNFVSTEGLLKIYNAINEAKKSDEKNPEKVKYYYGFYKYNDFKAQSDAIEKILNERGIDFEKIIW